jgi:hypothetical protein
MSVTIPAEKRRLWTILLVLIICDFQQIQEGQQIVFSNLGNLLASLNLLEKNEFSQKLMAPAIHTPTPRLAESHFG